MRIIVIPQTEHRNVVRQINVRIPTVMEQMIHVSLVKQRIRIIVIQIMQGRYVVATVLMTMGMETVTDVGRFRRSFVRFCPPIIVIRMMMALIAVNRVLV